MTGASDKSRRGLWGATFFYALRYDTVYDVEKVLQQLQTLRMQGSLVKHAHLEDAETPPDAQERLRSLPKYEDGQYDQKQ